MLLEGRGAGVAGVIGRNRLRSHLWLHLHKGSQQLEDCVCRESQGGHEQVTIGVGGHSGSGKGP